MKKKEKKVDPFKNLQTRLTITVMIIIGSVLLGITLFLNIYLVSYSKRENNLLLDLLMENDGFMESRLNEVDPEVNNHLAEGMQNIAVIIKSYAVQAVQGREEIPEMRGYFSARLDHDKNIISTINHFTYTVDSSDEADLVSSILKQKKKNSFYKYIKYRLEERNYGYLLCAIDCVEIFKISYQLASVSATIFFFALIIAYIASSFISKTCIHPVRETFYEQKKFIADASHELKTPLAIISANVSVLEQDIPGNKWLEYIKTANDRMSEMVTDLLYLAKSDAGRLDYAMDVLDFAGAMARAILPFESVAWEQKKKLVINIPSTQMYVSGNEVELQRLAGILVDNAIKNCDPGDTIRVTVSMETMNCYLYVYNTGHGISKEDQKHIFQRFYRADTSRNRATGGYGLGLAIAQSISEHHKGKLSVESEPDKYAQFTFSIPRKIETAILTSVNPLKGGNKGGKSGSKH